VLDAVTAQPARLNATARGRCLLARRVANRVPRCGVRHAASGGSVRPCTRVWIFGATRKPAGTRAAACRWRRWLAHGGLPTVPSDGADKGRWSTAGLYTRLRVASSGADLRGAPGRPALLALGSAIAGVQPARGYRPRPSGPGKEAASSRCALRVRRASVVSTASASERVETTPCNGGRRNRNCLERGGLSIPKWPQGPLWGRNAGKRPPRNG